MSVVDIQVIDHMTTCIFGVFYTISDLVSVDHGDMAGHYDCWS